MTARSMPTPFLTLNEAATRLGLQPGRLTAIVKRAPVGIPGGPINVGSGTHLFLRFPPETLESWLSIATAPRDAPRYVATPPSPRRPQFVYLIQSSTRVKIGYSVDPQARMRDLQTARAGKLRLLRTYHGGRELENALHGHFAVYRMGGEWFEMRDDFVKRVDRFVAAWMQEP